MNKILSLSDKNRSNSTPVKRKNQCFFSWRRRLAFGCFVARRIESCRGLWQTLRRMYLDHVPARTVLLLLALVALLFFVQVPQGSYQAMHGPTTTQRDIMGRTLLQLVIALGVYAWRLRGQLRLVLLHAADGDEPDAFQKRDLPFSSALRC